jgi:ribosomal protein L15
MIISALAILLCFGSVKAYQNRHQILTAVAIVKCRWFNRGYKAPMPTVILPEDKCNDISEASPASDEEPIDEENVDENIARCFEVDAERADTLISDSLAKSLVNREGEIVYTSGIEREIINLGDISSAFDPNDRVDVNSLKEKQLISSETGYIKVLGGGKIDKPLLIYANDFSLSAVKMIALTGGKVIRVVTFKERSKDEKE